MQRKICHAGFTLIELVVVITILGILAAFAVPRFASLEQQARLASIQALGGSVRAGAALSHAQWLASNRPGTVAMEGAAVPIAMVNGYPSLATIDDAVADLSGYTYDASSGVFTKIGAGSTCTVTYVEAAPSGSPSITVGSAC